MQNQSLPVLGIILGDHAGSSPEMAAKAVLANDGSYIPVFTGNLERFRISCQYVEGIERLEIRPLNGRPTEGGPNVVYFCDVPSGPDIRFSTITADNGRLTYDSMIKMMELERAGIVDGICMAPITKAVFHAADIDFDGEYDLFADFYGTKDVNCVLKCGPVFHSTVVGHYAFRDIPTLLTTQGIVDTTYPLLDVLKSALPPERWKIAVAALNPHAGEGGLFGDEEARIIQPAVEQLVSEGIDVIGPCPADTVFMKAVRGEVAGIVFLYHDQSNIAMKARYFGEGVLVYTHVPALIVSVAHGPAYGKAGKGTADPGNLIASIDFLLELVLRRRASDDAE